MRTRYIKLGVVVCVLIVLMLIGAYWFFTRQTSSNINTTQSSALLPAVTPRAAQQSAPSFNKAQYSTTESASLWVIASKKYPLVKGYAPQELVVPSVPLRLDASAEQMYVSSVIKEPLQQLVNAAEQEGVMLKLSSGYRSEALQAQLYNTYVARDGQAAADRYSARPGTSEHQTGLAVDIMAQNGKCSLETCFATTPEGMWLAQHAYKYGFTIRYRDGKETVTGYQYEPWHFRYVGIELATELQRLNVTMEEFFGH